MVPSMMTSATIITMIMTKTILLGMNNRFPAKANKWLFSGTGLLFLINGISNIFRNAIEPIGFILGVLMTIGGLFYLRDDSFF